MHFPIENRRIRGKTDLHIRVVRQVYLVPRVPGQTLNNDVVFFPPFGVVFRCSLEYMIMLL